MEELEQVLERAVKAQDPAPKAIMVLTPHQQSVYADMIRESNMDHDNQENIIALIAQSQGVDNNIEIFHKRIQELESALNSMDRKYDQLMQASNQSLMNLKLDNANKMNDFLMTFMMSVTKLEKNHFAPRVSENDGRAVMSGSPPKNEDLYSMYQWDGKSFCRRSG